MTELRQLAAQLAVIRELERRVADAKSALNLALLDSLDPGDTKAATLDDGTVLGKVSVTMGSHRPTVTDERALREWVRANRPDELVETVRESFVKALKDSAKRHGAAVIESTGEVVPGIEIREANPYVSYRAAPGAAELIAERWHDMAGEALRTLPGDAP